MNRAVPDWIHNNGIADLKREIERLNAMIALLETLNKSYLDTIQRLEANNVRSK